MQLFSFKELQRVLLEVWAKETALNEVDPEFTVRLFTVLLISAKPHSVRLGGVNMPNRATRTPAVVQIQG